MKSKQYNFIFIIFILFISSCVRQHLSVDDDPKKGYQILQGKFQDIRDAISDALYQHYPGVFINTTARKIPGFSWIDPAENKSRIAFHEVKGENEVKEEISGYIYILHTKLPQRIVTSLQKRIEKSIENYGISKAYVKNYSIIEEASEVIGEKDEKDQAIVIPTSVLGDVKDTTTQILQNTLENELKSNFRLISQEIFEKAQAKAFEELDYDECTEDQCIMLIQEMLQVENVFHLQIVTEEKDTQLSLSWRTLDENIKQAVICMGCSTIKLNKKIIELTVKLLKN